MTQYSLLPPLILNLSRIELRAALDEGGSLVVQALLRIATKSEEVFDYPENFLTRLGRAWHTFKVRYFPRWLKKRVPIITNRVWSIHKFPELNLPPDLTSGEYVHFRIIPEKLLPGNNKAPQF